MTAASASARRWGASASTSSGLASAFTRSRVWKVDTSGQVHLVLDEVAGDPAQPVVGMDGVEGEVLVRRRIPRRPACS